MKIGHKLFSLVILATAIAWISSLVSSRAGEAALRREIIRSSKLRSQSTMREILRTLHDRVIEWQAIRHDPALKSLLRESNIEFEALPNRENFIAQADSGWKAAKESFPLAVEIESNPVSKNLRTWISEFEIELGYPLYPEVFVTNRFGVNVAQTGTTSDYRQNDELWWNVAAKEELYIGDVEFDESAQAYALSLGVRVDGRDGKLLGVMKVMISIREIIDIVNSSAGDSSERVVLFDHTNRPIAASGKSAEPFSIEEEFLQPVLTEVNDNGWTVELSRGPNGEKYFQSYSGIGEHSWFQSLSWTVMIEQPDRIAFAPLWRLQTQLLYFNLLGTLLCLCVGAFISLSITRRLSKVMAATESIAAGDQDVVVAMSGQDEVAKLSQAITHMSGSLSATQAELENALDSQKTLKSILEISLKSQPLKEKLQLSLDVVLATPWLAVKPSGGIFLRKEDGSRELQLTVEKGLGKPLLTLCDTVPFGHCLCGRAAESKKLQFAECLDCRHETTYEGMSPHGHYNVPILDRDELLGVLVLYLKEGHKSTDIEREYVRAIGQALAALILRHRIDVELERARRLAEEGTRAKSEFLASMSHELRTPMNSIMGFTQRLIKKIGHSLAARDLDALETVGRNAKHLLELINDILDLSKIEAGKMALDRARFDLVAVLNGVASTLEPLAAEKGLHLEVELPESELIVLADRTKLTQIVTNLLSNGVRYTDAGSVNLRLESSNPNGAEGEVRIYVKDSGIGIRDEDLSRLFSKFTQLDQEEHRRKGGTGLGLAITQEYVEMHGGRIEVTSRWQEGSEFSVILPIQAAQQRDSAIRPPEAPQRVSEFAMKILCVDDDPDVLKYLKLTFEEEGYDVVLAKSHDEALAAVANSAPDLICLDICMPGKSGYDVLESLKDLPDTEKIPVVVVSAIADFPVPRNRRVTCYLTKPIDSGRLMSEVRTALAGDVESVLLVEDCDDSAKLIEHTIQEYGIEVVRTANGAEALSVLAERSFSAIVLDLMMPKMDGFSFLRECESHPESLSTPVFIMTAKKLEVDEIEFLKRSSEAILTKGKQSTTALIDSILHHLRVEQQENC